VNDFGPVFDKAQVLCEEGGDGIKVRLAPQTRVRCQGLVGLGGACEVWLLVGIGVLELRLA
jgi:hypothetical protein